MENIVAVLRDWGMGTVVPVAETMVPMKTGSKFCADLRLTIFNQCS